MQVGPGWAQEVRFRALDDYLFTSEFKCFGDWNTTMHGGSWLFRHHVVVIEEYNGQVNIENMTL